MIIIIDGLNNHKYPKILDEMFKLRKRVFQDRMGWEVDTRNGREFDAFDELNPSYVISLSPNMSVTGCARLLQTTGPHMLSDVFSAILDGEPPLRSARLWESTRFCVDRDSLEKGAGRNSVSYTTAELMIGIMEYARDSGIADIITVIDPVMDRELKRSENAPYDYVGKVADMGRAKALACLIDCTDERITRVRDYAGIKGEIMLGETELDQILAQKAPQTLQPNLNTHCQELLTHAVSHRERADAFALSDALEMAS